MNFSCGYDVHTAADLKPYYMEIHFLMVKKDFVALNKILLTAPTKEISIMLMVGIARLMYSIQEWLPAYNNYIILIYAEIEKRGEDACVILHGL